MIMDLIDFKIIPNNGTFKKGTLKIFQKFTSDFRE